MLCFSFDVNENTLLKNGRVFGDISRQYNGVHIFCWLSDACIYGLIDGSLLGAMVLVQN